MRPGLSLEIRPILKQTQSAEQRLDIKMTLAHQVEENINDVRERSEGPPENILVDLIERVIDSTENENIKNSLKALFKDQKLISHLAKNMEGLAVLTKPKIAGLVVNYVHEENNNGSFQETKLNEKNETVLGESYKVLRNDLFNACVNPEKISKELEENKRLLSDLVNDTGTGLTVRIHELQDAATVMKMLRPHIDILANAMQYVLVKKNKDGIPEVADFIKDWIILRKLTFVESERLIKRFIDRCESVGKKRKPENVKNYFMNTIGEFTLISMGIIGQEMFSLRKGQIDKDMYVELKKDLAGSDIDLDKLMETCRLNNTGAFFWNRWKTLEKKPSRITDEKIREFLTQTVRADEDEIMDKIGYVEMIERVKEINFGDYDNREDRHEAFRELFVKTFSQEEFKSSIISLLKNKWYQKLEIFYQT